MNKADVTDVVVSGAWAWMDMPGEVDPFHVSVDYDRSSLRRYRLLGPELINPEEGTITFDAHRYSSKYVAAYSSLQMAASHRVVHRRIAPVLRDFLSEDEMQLFPVSVRCKDATLDEFLAVIPLTETTCVDFEKSKFTSWIIPNEVTSGYKSVAFVPGALGSRHLTRESVTGLVLVSDRLKAALESTGGRGFHFVRDNDVPPYFN